MASTNTPSGVTQRFKNQLYCNWVKVGQALQCTARGLGHFCKTAIEPYHQLLIQTLPPTQCYGTCRGNPCNECLQRRTLWKNHLTVGSKPCWANCDLSRWETNYWEIAKIFMGEGQPATATGPNTTDQIGIFKLILQCDLFDSSISNRQKVRDIKRIRNELFHAATFQVTDANMHASIDAMVTLLTDPLKLNNDPLAKAAVRQLRKIETLVLDVNDQNVVQTERDIWKNMLDFLSQDQGVTRTQVDRLEDFMHRQEDLNNRYRTELRCLRARHVIQEGSRRCLWMCPLLLALLVLLLAIFLQSNGYLVEQPLHWQEHRVNKVEGQFAAHDTLLQEHERRLGEGTGQFAAHDTLLQEHERRLGEGTGQLAAHDTLLQEHERRLDEGTGTTHITRIVISLTTVCLILFGAYRLLRLLQSIFAKASLKEKLRKRYRDSLKHDTFVELHLQTFLQETLPETITYRDVEDMERRRRSSPVVSLSQLLSKLENDDVAPKKVLIRGRPGVGKTTLVEYIAKEWAINNLWPHFDFVIVIKLRDLEDVEWDLGALLFGNLQLDINEQNAALDDIWKNSKRALLIVDSLDEYSSFLYSKGRFPKNSKVDLSKMISSIISCSLLAEATVVVTSRPTAQIPSKVFDRVVDIYGFTKDGIKQYVNKFCTGNMLLGKFIWKNIDTNPNIATFCHTPVQCWFLCDSLKDMFNHSTSDSMPCIYTMTQLYVKATLRLGQMLRPTEKADETNPSLGTVFRRLKEPFLKHVALARDCMTYPLRIIFSDEDLDQHGFTVEDKQTGFLSGSKKTDPDDSDKTVNSWSFTHLSLQEFFSAIGMLLGTHIDIQMLLQNEHLVKQNDVVITFLAGLLGDPSNAYYLKHLGITDASLDVCKDFIFELKSKLENDPLKMLTVVYETQCKDLLEYVPVEIKSSTMYPMEMLSLSWVLVQNTCRVNRIDLSECELDSNLVKLLCDALKQNSTVQKLILNFNAVFADEDAGRSLGSALAVMPNLLILSMWECDLSVKSWSHIANGISLGGAPMEVLGLSFNAIFADEDAGRALGCVLARMTNLRILSIQLCHLSLKSLPHIVDGISRGCPRLEKLYLTDNPVFVEEDAGRLLGSALTVMSSLLVLSLRLCQLSLKSWTHIIAGIRGCPRLERLFLTENSVFAEEEAGRSLGSALASMSNLLEFSVWNCQLSPNSWLHIVDGLSLGCPRMERLFLNQNAIFGNEVAGRSLGSALAEMTNLRVLSMRQCDLSVESWPYVVDGMSRGGLLIERFLLAGNAVFADEGVGQSLGAVLANMPNLRVLSIRLCELSLKSWNHIVNGISMGCPRMEELDCKWNEQLKDESEENFTTFLRRQSRMTIRVYGCGLSDQCRRRLKAEFGDRFDLEL